MTAKLLHFLLCFYTSILLSSCSYYHISAERVSVIEISENGDDNEGDEDIANFIAPYSEKLNKAMDEIIGTAEYTLNLQKPESLLGNFLADVVQESCSEQLEEGKKLFSVLNYGGIRINEIPSGPITRGNIYELLPFENMIVIMEMNQAQLLQFLNHISTKGPWPVSKEISYTINSADNTVQNIKIHNAPINNSESYYVAMPDYIANGGDDCSFLKALPRESTGLLLRDAVISFIENSNDPCTAEIDGRITYE